MPSLKGGIVFYITERTQEFSTYSNAAVDSRKLYIVVVYILHNRGIKQFKTICAKLK